MIENLTVGVVVGLIAWFIVAWLITPFTEGTAYNHFIPILPGVIGGLFIFIMTALDKKEPDK